MRTRFWRELASEGIRAARRVLAPEVTPHAPYRLESIESRYSFSRTTCRKRAVYELVGARNYAGRTQWGEIQCNGVQYSLGFPARSLPLIRQRVTCPRPTDARLRLITRRSQVQILPPLVRKVG
jgi:hypothetical protein